MDRKPTRPRVVGRGERVVPGIWRLRLPLPFPASHPGGSEPDRWERRS